MCEGKKYRDKASHCNQAPCWIWPFSSKVHKIEHLLYKIDLKIGLFPLTAGMQPKKECQVFEQKKQKTKWLLVFRFRQESPNKAKQNSRKIFGKREFEKHLLEKTYLYEWEFRENIHLELYWLKEKERWQVFKMFIAYLKLNKANMKLATT